MTERALPAAGDLDAAIAHHQAGRLIEAETAYRRILQTAPGDVDALHLLGLMVLEKGDGEEAVTFIEKAIALKPDVAPFHNSLGNALKAKGDLDGACESFRRALALDPALAGTHVNLGAELRGLGKLDEALDHFRDAIQLEPGLVEAHNQLGRTLCHKDDFEGAVNVFKQSLDLAPGQARIHGLLGIAFRNLENFDDAVACQRQALEIDPTLASAHNDLGDALKNKGDFDGAVCSFQRAVKLDPTNATVHNNLGTAYLEAGRMDDALACLQEAIRLTPDNEKAEIDLALLFLLRGRFAEGWHAFLARDSVRHETADLYRQPLASDLSGTEIFLRKNQGLGDEIFFLRFAPELKKRGAQITYKAGAKIEAMVSRLPFLHQVVDERTPTQRDKINVSSGDLPYMLDMKSVRDIPPSVKLDALPSLLSGMETRLRGLGPAPYIGVTWRAGTPGLNRSLFKEVPLELIGNVLKDLDGTLMALQRLPQAGEIEALSAAAGRPVHDFTALNDELEDMLALLSLIDEYVTVSNTNVHLRAGAGRTSRVLVPFPPEWRWMPEGDESPWFPDHPIYRQKLDRSWDEAFARLDQDLRRALGPSESPLS